MALPRQITNLGTKYIDGLNMLFESGLYEFSIAPGQCRDSTGSIDLVISEQKDIDVRVLTTGPGGVDVGPLSGDSLYSIYVIGSAYGARPTDIILSLSHSGPVLPSGYDVYRRIGSIRTIDAGGSGIVIKGFTQLGDSKDRWLIYAVPTTFLSSGSATTDTAIDFSSQVPPGRKLLRLRVNFSADTVFSTLTMKQRSGIADEVFLSNGSDSFKWSQLLMSCNTDSSILYKVTSSSTVTVVLIGYQDIL